jgi:hypothetical protein
VARFLGFRAKVCVVCGAMDKAIVALHPLDAIVYISNHTSGPTGHCSVQCIERDYEMAQYVKY